MNMECLKSVLSLKRLKEATEMAAPKSPVRRWRGLLSPLVAVALPGRRWFPS